MGISLRGRNLRPLVLGWAAYWVGLAGVSLTPLVRAIIHATGLPDGHSSVNVSAGGAGLDISVVADGVKTWASTTPISTILLWFAGPPLVMWLVWLLSRPRARADAELLSETSPAALASGTDPAAPWQQRQREQVGFEDGRVRTPNP